MICPCPKCQAENDIEPSEIPSGGKAQDCPECKSRFWAVREPFALRAYKKEGDIFCEGCGEQLGPSTFCPGCGALFPAYCVVQISKPARRKEAKTTPVKFSKVKVRRPRAAPSGDLPHPAPAAPRPSHGANRPMLLKICSVFLVLFLASLLGSVFYAKKKEGDYSKNYVFALYGIKSGTDLSLKKCTEMAGRMNQPTPGGAGISNKEIAELKAVKSEIDLVLTRLQNPPQKFSQSHDQLLRLYAQYEQILAFATSNKPQPPDEFTGSVSRLETDFLKEAQKLKASLPEELSTELKTSVGKYKSLQFLI